MSAIFGILDLAGRQLNDAWIKSMQQDMVHRGPDGQELYREDSVALGHLLLQVTPESIYDTSPYEEGDLVITANARLDERDDLMDKLNIVGEERNKITDPQLLLRSYRKEGKNFVKNIYGDFSFAIWDKQKKELFCARDQMGIKPFLYYFQDNRFVFSTELKAIVKLPFVETSLDQIYWRDKAIAIFDKPQETGWTDIARLQSAHTLTLKDGKISINNYWLPKYKRNKEFKKEEQSSEALRKLLEKVIGDQTRVIGEVGAHLSGGLDSSSIVCIAARNLRNKGKKITTASSVNNPGFLDADNPDEMEYINEVLLQEQNILPTFIYDTDLQFFNGLEDKLNRHYVPVNSYYYVDDALYNEFKLKSTRRVLSGYLGDGTVSNSTINPVPLLFLTARFGALSKLLKKFRSVPNQPVSALIKYSMLNDLAPTVIRKAWNKYKGRIDNFWNVAELPLILDPNETIDLQKKVLTGFSRSNRKLNDITRHIWPGNTDFFEEEMDCASSHHQLEMSYPLCDRRIVELLLQFPVEHFYANGAKRGLLRKAMSGILPEKVRNRKNKGSYSPGFATLIKKEIPSINTFLQKIPVDYQINNLLNLQKLKFDFENLSESINEDIFGYKFLSRLELITWVYFTLWSKKVNDADNN